MGKIKFQLAGTEYEISNEEVEEKLRYFSPKPVNKYFVLIDGRVFPPKQVVAAALGIPLVSFTTMDANRVLASLGFELRETSGPEEIEKTESEVFFEEYLNSSGLTEFHHEKEYRGIAKRPDYSFLLGDAEILFEIKEFRATRDDFKLGGGAYDPYAPIREKIEAARKKFKEFEGYCCCLVLYNREKPLVHLEWQYIYGAMLGNLGFAFDVDPSLGKSVGEIRPVFSGGGKMHRHDHKGHTIAVQNTTISAVLLLEQFRIGYRRFETEVRRKERELGREFTFEEHWQMIQHTRGTERDVSLTQLRVIVHENPYSKIPLIREIFRGPYDERYGNSNGQIGRIFVGEEIAKLEESEKATNELHR